jgi:malonyl-CoA reductase/3-hydroxypropionate dehydrogenase (NADP+)
VHQAVLAALREGVEPEETIMAWRRMPWPTMKREGRPVSKSLAKLFAQVEDSREGGNSTAYLLNRDLAEKLMNRLVTGGLFTPEQRTASSRLRGRTDAVLRRASRGQKAAEGIEAGILNRLHLHKMPTDEQIGLSTVFHLADDIASGETFHPSGGLKFDRSVTEGELLLRPDREALARLEGKRVVLIGDAMREELSAIGEGFLESRRIARWWC